MALTEYDELGRCTGTEIIVVICSKSPGGATDPTTAREYKLYCPNCQSKIFFEGEDLDTLWCAGCTTICGMKDMTDGVS